MSGNPDIFLEKNYLYTANGTKLKKEVLANGVFVNANYYSGEFVYYVNGLSNGIEYILTDEGRSIPQAEGSFKYEYFLKDHLGNTRVSFADYDGNGIPEVVQEDAYYPFGMQLGGLSWVSGTSGSTNKFLYSGKELQDDHGYNEYDFGARHYMPDLGRWSVPDLLSELAPDWSPFRYAFNNPMKFVDPDGLWEGDYYTKNGVYLGSDGIDDNLGYTAKKEDLVYQKDGKTIDKDKTTNKSKFTDKHDEFATSANVVMNESSGNKTESLWIAHTANNAKDNNNIDFKKQNTTLYDQLTDEGYSTTSPSARTELSTSANSSAANNARAAVIDVLTGGTDPTGGAVLWDGDDFLSKGTAHNKFNEYSNVSVSNNHLWNYAMVPSRPGNSINGVFWSPLIFNTDFSKSGNSTRNFSLYSTGAQGKTIFWNIKKK